MIRITKYIFLILFLALQLCTAQVLPLQMKDDAKANFDSLLLTKDIQSYMKTNTWPTKVAIPHKPFLVNSYDTKGIGLAKLNCINTNGDTVTSIVFRHHDPSLTIDSDVFIRDENSYIFCLLIFDFEIENLENFASLSLSRNHPVSVYEFSISNRDLHGLFTHDPSSGGFGVISGKYFNVKEGQLINIKDASSFTSYSQSEFVIKKFESYRDMYKYIGMKLLD